ncbi:MAG: YXWGXW repeat-containing protein [Opitutaceae bacterium]
MPCTLVLVRAAQFAGLAAAAALLGGCGRRPIIVQSPPPPPPTATVIHTPAPVAPQPVVGTPTRDVVVVREAPPPPREEAPPPPPTGPGSYTWLPGYWSVRDGRQEWIPGRYETPPRTGATWVAPRWERRADGYVFVDGYWR